RPQPCAVDSGVRKKPRPDRGPKVRMAIRQPLPTISAGARQPSDLCAMLEVTVIDPISLSRSRRCSRHGTKLQVDANRGRVMTKMKHNDQHHDNCACISKMSALSGSGRPRCKRGGGVAPESHVVNYFSAD